MNSIFFLHSFVPGAVAFSLGRLTVHWYGVCLAMAMLVAIFVTIKLAKAYEIKTDLILDLAIWVIIGGLVGARIYDVFLNWSIYNHDLLEVFKVWHGGLAIHGGIIGGAIILIIFAYYKKISFYKLACLIAPGLAIGQAIGRFGNWFNQELFGLPTNSFIGVPISLVNRPLGYENYIYFQPTFLYESLFMLVIGIILYKLVVNKKSSPRIILAIYLIAYGLIRFILEFIKIDPTPTFLFLRWPQVISLLMIIIGSYIIMLPSFARQKRSSKGEE